MPSAFSADGDRLRRFEQEARAAGRLNHPDILAIYDVRTCDASPYIVSELLEGGTLRDQLGGSALPHRKTVDYAMQIAHGLASAHAKGIIHRDLKPENLFVTNDGRVKILDFGLAKLTHPVLNSSDVTDASTELRPTATAPGVLMGTAGYISPEQVRGQVADHRSDIFAYRAILYEMVSGQRAFQGNSAVEMMNAILKQEPPELSAPNHSTSPALERIMRHCLEKSSEQRFQSASNIAFNLEDLIGPSSVAEHPTPGTVRLKRRDFFAGTKRFSFPPGGSHWRLVVPGESTPARLPFVGGDGLMPVVSRPSPGSRLNRVISRTSVMRYKGSPKSLPEIAAELKVDAAIEGTVQRSGGRVRVTAKLIPAATDSPVWARAYERDLTFFREWFRRTLEGHFLSALSQSMCRVVLSWACSMDRLHCFLIDPQWRICFTIGFCGAFTTFSTLVFETVQLASGRELFLAATNVIASLALGFIFLWLGIVASRAL